VRSAVETGVLPANRLASYHKLMREAQVVAAKTNARGRAEEHRRDRIFGKAAKDYHKRAGRDQW
jgi:hypothetical protein